ncbi:MAG: hypothetical protein A2487_07270 [Candidatus Raymondbacteria bacterium RifOxyC12_full_50_8]|uniref:Uncharacterized protein n=1 Tax=Candidatus Raymondbacteria bacterium RIFOXYD12_FULL_49_13 TaxID=1817890 RepID=A0A1F7F3B6_UNCRA|nr:MAG: hypothetical protein A2248_08900 [Candidatus Raymondbacteria bacterium RIFOXYA2_FULL_49_16]OGJ96779.1 MAG: hypothetical protein A2487_07270 [Candidatus Raymondbacteria bacterium RifOxyC12_full_50_8]OGK01131.1 MAG: hypothetical protein A2519_20430 [Candidatus Raymondbacteria bacterium RIFOXYD12_FULL_49_13]OGP39352.1 MAG: hypothetical protein A2324_16940 [Candidatus Raymondbacteria bacterium RIFOXYB2_FULL_49_35]
MSFIISIVFAVKSILLFTGAVAQDKSAAYFDQPQIIVVGEEVKMSCGLHNAFPDELKKLAATGTEIPLYFFIEIKTSPSQGTLHQTIIEHTLRYDLIAKQYWVVRKPAMDTLGFASADSAIAQACTFPRFSAFPLSIIDKDKMYTITSYAVLGKAMVEALENHSIDLMYYWNYKRPTIKTEKIPGGQFLARGRK